MTTGCGNTTTERPFEGVLPNMERRFRETDSAWIKEELGRYQSTRTCEVCNGDRLKPEALAVKIAGKHISEVAGLSISEAGRLVLRHRREAHPEPARDRRSASSRRSTSGSAF